MKWILNIWAGKTLLKEEVSSSSLDGFYIDHPSHSKNIFLNVKDTVWSGIFFHSIKNHIFKTYALKIDNLVVFSVFTSLCHIITYKFQNISPVQKETAYPLSVAPHSSRSFRSWQPRIYLLSLETCLIVEVSYTWNLMMHGLLCLASFTKHNVHPYCIMCQYFIPFLWLNNVPLYGYIFYLPILKLVGIWIVSTFWKFNMLALSCVWLLATPWTVTRQDSLSMEFSRQEYWSGLPFPSPGDLSNPGIEPGSPALQVDSLPI